MTQASRVEASDVCLTLRAGAEALTLPGGLITEILRPRRLTRVPHAPHSLLGVTSLRGAVLPVVSLARLLGKTEPQGAISTARIVVVNEGSAVGVLVDEVFTFGTGATTDRMLDLKALLARDFCSASTLKGGRRRDGPAGPSMAGPSMAGRSAAEAARHELPVALLAFVGLRIAGQDYALPIEAVTAIAALPADVTEVAGLDPAMRGVMTWRDGLVPLVSLRVLLGRVPQNPGRRLERDRMDPNRSKAGAKALSDSVGSLGDPACSENAPERVVMLRFGATGVGLVVDQVCAIWRLPADAVDPVPRLLTRGRSEAKIEAIGRIEAGRRLVSILSPQRLFDAATAECLLGMSGPEASPMAAGQTRLEQAQMSDTPRLSSQSADASWSRGASAAVERFLLFQLEDEHYGLPLGGVEEVLRCPAALTSVPRAPAFVAGVIDRRGTVLPVIDQRRRFGLTAQDDTRGRRIVVLRLGDVRAGFLVDRVSEVLAIPVEALRAAPALTGEAVALFDRIATIERDGHLILLVDPAALLDRAERDLLAAFGASASVAPQLPQRAETSIEGEAAA